MASSDATIPGTPNGMALSAAAMGKIRIAAAAGRAIPGDWATDKNGVPTTDPAAAIEGMLLPAAGPKGFGLAVMIDLLTGGLSSGGVGSAIKPLYGDPGQPYDCAHFFLAIQVGAFRSPASFEGLVGEVVQRIRTSRPVDPASPVMDLRGQSEVSLA